MQIRTIIKGGYPVRPDDLPLWAWIKLGEAESYLSALERVKYRGR
jgi:hypothetical protein